MFIYFKGNTLFLLMPTFRETSKNTYNKLITSIKMTTSRLAIFLSGTALLLAFNLTSCNDSDIEGRWIQPVPGMEGMTQGFCIEKGGKASSINMATLQYETWEQDGNLLILTGKSIGNKQTCGFSDTLLIKELTDNTLTLLKGESEMRFTKQ